MSVFSMFANAGLNWLFLRHLVAPGIASSTNLLLVMSSVMVMLYVQAQILQKQPSHA